MTAERVPPHASQAVLGRRLTTPRAAAVAGLMFTVLFGTALVLVRTAIPRDASGAVDDLARSAGQLAAAEVLMPLAGIAFLWFLGVVRDRLGQLEDRFFSSVMFGSGLLFLAMIFVAMAFAGGLLAVARGPVDPVERTIIGFGQEVMVQISSVYALRMAGVFMISLGTIWLRTGLMPRWVVVGTYLPAAVLLLVVSVTVWVTLLFPAWVGAVSIVILLNTFRPSRDVTRSG
jgi:hypothetical protein